MCGANRSSGTRSFTVAYRSQFYVVKPVSSGPWVHIKHTNEHQNGTVDRTVAQAARNNGPERIRTFGSAKRQKRRRLRDTRGPDSSTDKDIPMDPDEDLLEVLKLASDEELEWLCDSLYGIQLLSPLGKSLYQDRPEGIDESRSRDGLIRRIERRFRFLAADAGATLQGRWPSYRETLLAIHSRLGVPCSPSLATHDLEAEIFLHLLREHADTVQAADVVDGVGEGAVQGASPVNGRRSPHTNILQRVLTPLKLGAREVVPILTKLGATFAVTNFNASVARELGAAVLKHGIQYEAALQLALSAGSKGLAGSVQGQIAVRTAQRGLTAAASRYAATRGILSFVGPIMWASTVVDLMRMSFGTDYTRLVRTVFALAQIRLLKTAGWTEGGQGDNDV